MYRITVDGEPLLDTRDDDLILTDPKVKIEVNRIGEGSFKIFKDHPNFDRLAMLKPVIEVSEKSEVIFRGYMTEHSRDFVNCKEVDIEGVMGYFNDSVVRPFDFPADWLGNVKYQNAASSGNVVEFFLEWLIGQHNEQVSEFQRFKLGRVTVSDPNNYITRADSTYSSTWKVLEDKLFGSALGGNLCIRYEADGNYIDYLAEFEEVNEQGIEYGENLLDFREDTDGTETYSAVIPLGATDDKTSKRLTISSAQGNGNITEDIVKKGDLLYSVSAVAAYGLKIAPVEDTTWDDVTEADNLLSRGLEHLETKAVKLSDSIEVVAADLHYTDEKIRSFRIYKKIPVFSLPHGVNDRFDLTRLEIDILHPQNTRITVGETKLTLTESNGKTQGSLRKLTKEYATVEMVNAKVEHKVDDTDTEKIVSMLNASASVINITADRLSIDSTNFKLTTNGTITAKAGQIGGFYIGTRSLHNGKGAYQDSLTGVYLGSDGIGCGPGKFYVTSAGDLYASSVNINGGKLVLKMKNGEYVRIGADVDVLAVDSATYASGTGVRTGILPGAIQFADGAAALSTTPIMFNYSAGEGFHHNLVGTWYIGGLGSSTPVTSDRNKKNSISPLADAYSAIFDLLKPVSFKYNNGTSDRTHTGLVAQEVVEAVEAAGLTTKDCAAVCYDIDEDGKKTNFGIRYEEFVSILIHEVQKLKAEMKTLKEGTANG